MLDTYGGPGSGNFGHGGRPGKRGGSSNKNSSGSEKNESGKEYFHGTSSDAIDSILSNGLYAQEDRRTFEEDEFYTGPRKNAVFISSDKAMSEYYAENALNSAPFKARPAVLTIEVPNSTKIKKDTADDFLRYQADEAGNKGAAEGQSYYTPKIEASWIKSITIYTKDGPKTVTKEDYSKIKSNENTTQLYVGFAIKEYTPMQSNSLNIYTMTADPGEYSIQEKQHDGKTYWVVPVVMMREGVHAGSHGPLLHRANDLGHFVESWNGIPVTVKHPQKDGKMVSANAPDILDSYHVGRVYGAYMDGDKLKGQAWLDPDRLKQVSDTAYQFIQNKQPLDVSVGVFTDDEVETGQWNSESYSAVAKNHRPDHLALLPGSRGACSWEDGCGIRVNETTNNEGEKQMAENKPCCPEKVELLIQDDDSKFTEDDRDWLLTMSEEQLEKIHPVVVTKEVIKEVEKPVQVNVEQAIQVLKAEMSDINKFMQLVPEKIKTQFQYGMKLHEDKRQELVEYITTNSQVWSKEELSTMEIGMLDKLAKTCGAKRTFMGAAAGGGSPTNNSETEMLLPFGIALG